MTDDGNKFALQRGIARGGHVAPPMTDCARKGLLDFLRREIVDEEWKIARAKASIEAYEAAIEAIEGRAPKPEQGQDPAP